MEENKLFIRQGFNKKVRANWLLVEKYIEYSSALKIDSNLHQD